MSWEQILITCVATIATGLASWLVTMLTKWLSSKIKDEKMRRCINALNDIIIAAVQSTNQTFVEAMKKDGSFTKEAAEEAFNQTMSIVKAQLTEDLKSFINENFGDIEAFLRAQIEAKVSMLKMPR